MQRYFVAYRFTGETEGILNERLSLVVEALRQAGIDAYCNFFDEHEVDKQNLTTREILDKAFSQIDESDGLFVLVASKDKSEGQLAELGYAYAKRKPIIAAVQEDVETIISGLAEQVISWRDLKDLKIKLEGLKV